MKKKISLQDLYVGQLGIARRNEYGKNRVFQPLTNNSYIIYKKCPIDLHTISDYGRDVILSSEYYFYNSFDNIFFDLEKTYINNFYPITVLLNYDEISKGFISKDRVLEILKELNKPKESKKVQNSDIILNSIFNIIHKLKDTNMVVENKEITFNDLTELAKNYINELIEIKTKNYSLDLTSETLIKKLQNDTISKLFEIVDNIGNGISIYSDDLTRTLEKN